MKGSLVPLLVCPVCRNNLKLESRSIEADEIMEGALRCSHCEASFPIVRGIPRFLPKVLSAEKRATADAFGYEWTNFSKLTDADSREFLAWISPLTPIDFEDRVVLDAGCGKGRHIFLAAKYKARTVVGVDFSDAVEAAFQNTRDLPNVHVLQADITSLPLTNSFDFVYSVGVLHHLPQPKEGFIALAKHAKPGGRISVWVYGKEGNKWIETLVDPIRRRITSRLPKIVTRCLSLLPATVLYAALKAVYRPAMRLPGLKALLPYSDYLCSISGYSFAENFWNVFDQLVAPTAFYHTEEEVADWFETIKGVAIRISRHNSNSWRGTAMMPENTRPRL